MLSVVLLQGSLAVGATLACCWLDEAITGRVALVGRLLLVAGAFVVFMALELEDTVVGKGFALFLG